MIIVASLTQGLTRATWVPGDWDPGQELRAESAGRESERRVISWCSDQGTRDQGPGGGRFHQIPDSGVSRHWTLITLSHHQSVVSDATS